MNEWRVCNHLLNHLTTRLLYSYQAIKRGHMTDIATTRAYGIEIIETAYRNACARGSPMSREPEQRRCHLITRIDRRSEDGTTGSTRRIRNLAQNSASAWLLASSIIEAESGSAVCFSRLVAFGRRDQFDSEGRFVEPNPAFHDCRNFEDASEARFRWKFEIG